MPQKNNLNPLVIVLSLMLVACVTYIIVNHQKTPATSKQTEQLNESPKTKAKEAPEDLTDADTLAVMGTRPDWNTLDIWQETITRDDFVNLLTNVYTVGDAWKRYITITDDHAIIRTDTRVNDATYKLKFSYGLSEASPDRNWSAAGDLPPGTKDKPLAGVHIAIDPGHIGGEFAKIEERWYKIGEDTKPVMEGNMTLFTAQIIKRDLQKLGAKVYLIRKENKPVSTLRPDDYRDMAEAKAAQLGKADDEKVITSIQNRYFYRTGEIRERARRVNLAFRPDLVLCLHFNAESWADPNNPTFTPKNHYHVLLHGALTSGEIAHDDERYEMMVKILQRSHDEEKPISAYISQGFAHYTGLPVFNYASNSSRAVKINVEGVEGLWARNLLANRIYQCPVIFLEPYVMNNQEVFDRVQMGDYDGKKPVNGSLRKSIYREYAEAVTEALKAYYLDYRIIHEPAPEEEGH